MEDIGQLGNGKYENRITPTLVKTTEGYLTDVIEVSAGSASSMAVELNGKAYSWGENSYKKLGIEENSSCYAVEITKVQDKEGNPLELNKMEIIEAGYYHSSISDEYGHVYSVGYNGQGALGTGDYTNRDIFTKIRKRRNTNISRPNKDKSRNK